MESEWEENFWALPLKVHPEGGDCCDAGSRCLSLWYQTLYFKALKTLCLGLSILVFYSVLWRFDVSRVYSFQNGQTLRIMILCTHQRLTPFCSMESSLNYFILVGKNDSFENVNSTVIIHGRHSRWRLITSNAKSIYLASFQVSLPLLLAQSHARLKALTQLAFHFNLVVLLCTYIILI